MKLYDQTDFDANRREKRRQIRRALMLALPFFALAIVAFVLRIELLCIAGFVIAGSILIFLYDRSRGRKRNNYKRSKCMQLYWLF